MTAPGSSCACNGSGAGGPNGGAAAAFGADSPQIARASAPGRGSSFRVISPPKQPNSSAHLIKSRLSYCPKIGRRGGNRTHNPRLRRPVLYPIELLAHSFYCSCEVIAARGAGGATHPQRQPEGNGRRWPRPSERRRNGAPGMRSGRRGGSRRIGCGDWRERARGFQARGG